MDITKIPGIMKKKRWDVGARVMETWFSRQAAIKPHYSKPPVMVEIDWALGYDATKDTYNEIFNEKIWANAAAKKVVKKWLNDQGLLNSNSNKFGDLSKDPEKLEDDYVNFRAVGSYLYYFYDYYYYSGMNDLMAALGRFVLRVAIAGTVEPSENAAQHQVTVEEVGIYIRDTYDFEGDQDLGYWDADDGSVSYLNPFSGDKVTNKSFRDWREANEMGGDFLIYSDVKRVELDEPHTFLI